MTGLPRTSLDWKALLQRVRRATRRSPDAEDLLQQAFVRMQEYASRNTVENPSAFVVRVARNLSIDAARQTRHRGEIMVETVDPDLAADRYALQDEVYESRKRLERVRAALAELSPRTRMVFLMHRIEGLKYREIAEQLDVTVSAVEKHIAKAVVHLAEVADEP
jgi:RNA polymerase sigma factor (sigma-70 family)